MSKPIPLLDVYAQNQPLLPEITAAIERVMKSSAFILGPEVKELEDELRTFMGANHVISCASGSDALILPLMCAGVGPGDEVLVPSFTFYATAAAAVRVGATPVFVDSDDTYNISLQDLERKITPKTKAIIPVHLFGLMVDMNQVESLINSQKQKIYVIEDCAQSIGAALDGKQSGTWGDYGAFSFYPTKNLGAMGDAGAMTAKHADCADRLRMLRVHGSKARYYHEIVGTNSRLDSIQAAVLRIKLRHLKEYEQRRERVASHYTKMFKDVGLAGNQIHLPITFADRKHVWNQYTVRTKERDRLRAYLSENAVGSEIYYPLAMHRQKAFADQIPTPLALSTCEALEREVLSLPIYPEMELSNVERVVGAIKAFYKG